MKYEMIWNEEIELYQIRALKDFNNVKSGELGGYIQHERNLSQYENAWVHVNARVYEDAQVCENARIFGNAEVFGDTLVYGNASVSEDAIVCEKTWVFGNSMIFGNAQVSGDAKISGNAMVYEDVVVYGKVEIRGNAIIRGNARVSEEFIYILGYPFEIIKTDLHLSVGCKQHTFSEWKKLLLDKDLYRIEVAKADYERLRSIVEYLVNE